MTWYTAAVDERVAAAVPVRSTFTFESQAEHWLASGQCDCIYYHNTYLWDFPIVAALIAPRPLLITVNQAANILNIGRTHIYQLFWDGILTPIHIGRSVRVATEQLEGLVRDRLQHS